MTAAQAEALATSGALDSVTTGVSDLDGRHGRDRRRALWAAGAAAGERAGTLPGTVVGLDAPVLPGMSDIELTIADVWATGISPANYPTEFSRRRLEDSG